MTIKEKLEKLGYKHKSNCDYDGRNVYARAFKGVFLWISIKKDKIYEYYINVGFAMYSERDIESVVLAFKELQKDVKELKKVINKLKNMEEDLEVLEILKKHMMRVPRVGFGTEEYMDMVLIPCEDEEDAKKVDRWLKNND